MNYRKEELNMHLTTEFDLGKYFTFELSKELPIHRWFYYKEGFAPQVTEWALKRETMSKEQGAPGHGHMAQRPRLLVDPFCGVGTSMLTAKSHRLTAIGSDVSPVAVLASRVKTEYYTKEEIEQVQLFLSRLDKLQEPPTYDWEFELFSPRAAFPKSNYNGLLALRYAISHVESEKIRNFLMLALLAIIPQVGIFIKDGGVLKIEKRKMAMPVKAAFKKKISKMVSDSSNQPSGPVPSITQSDARALSLDEWTADIVVTSPPYLNNVDYTKVYGLELSLLFLDTSITKQIRGDSLRSFITSNLPPENVPEEIGEIGYTVPVIGNYFADLEKAILEIKRVLKPQGACYLVIGNSVIHGMQIFVDELLAAIAERHGMQAEIIVGAERIADVKPRRVKIRESVVVMRRA